MKLGRGQRALQQRHSSRGWLRQPALRGGGGILCEPVGSNQHCCPPLKSVCVCGVRMGTRGSGRCPSAQLTLPRAGGQAMPLPQRQRRHHAHKQGVAGAAAVMNGDPPRLTPPCGRSPGSLVAAAAAGCFAADRCHLVGSSSSSLPLLTQQCVNHQQGRRNVGLRGQPTNAPAPPSPRSRTRIAAPPSPLPSNVQAPQLAANAQGPPRPACSSSHYGWCCVQRQQQQQQQQPHGAGRGRGRAAAPGGGRGALVGGHSARSACTHASAVAAASAPHTAGWLASAANGAAAD